MVSLESFKSLFNYQLWAVLLTLFWGTPESSTICEASGALEAIEYEILGNKISLSHKNAHFVLQAYFESMLHQMQPI